MGSLDFIRDNLRWLSAGVLLTFMSSFGQTFFISIFAGEIREAFTLSHGAWGGIYSLGTTASAIAMIWAGGLTDRFRSRALGAIVLTGLAASCLAMTLTPSAALLPVAIFALRFMGQGMTSHIAIVSMSRWFIATRGRALAVAGLGVNLGGALLPLLFVWGLTLVDWRLLWVVAAGIALTGIPLLGWLLNRERTPQSMATESVAATGMDGKHWTRNAAFRHPLFWLMVPALLGPPAFGTAFFFQQVHYAEVTDIALLELVALYPLFTGVTVAAMIGSGIAVDRFGAPRVLPWYLLPSTAAFALFAWAGGLGAVSLGLVFLGLTQGAQSTLPSVFWAEFFGTRHLGAIKAMGAAVMVFGTALGPGLTGYLIDLEVTLSAQHLGIALYFIGASLLVVLGMIRYAPRLVSVTGTPA